MKLPLPKDWTKFRSSLCRTCWASCCHGSPVEASIPDLIRLGLLTEQEAVLGLCSAVARLKREKKIQSFRPKALIAVLPQKTNGDCGFLDKNRRCTVYEKRPQICREFPKIGPNPNHCPYLPVSR